MVTRKLDEMYANKRRVWNGGGWGYNDGRGNLIWSGNSKTARRHNAR